MGTKRDGETGDINTHHSSNSNHWARSPWFTATSEDTRQRTVSKPSSYGRPRRTPDVVLAIADIRVNSNPTQSV